MEDLTEVIQVQLHSGHRVLLACDVKAIRNGISQNKVLAVVEEETTRGRERALFVYAGKHTQLFLEYAIPIHGTFKVEREETSERDDDGYLSEMEAPGDRVLDLLHIPTVGGGPISLQTFRRQQQDDLLMLIDQGVVNAEEFGLKEGGGSHPWLKTYRCLSAMDGLNTGSDSVSDSDQLAASIRDTMLDTVDDRIGQDWIAQTMLKRRDEYTEKTNIRVLCGTWNVNGKTCTQPVDPWIDMDREKPADIVTVGFQEVDLTAGAFLMYETPKEEEWHQVVSGALAKYGNYVKVDSRQLVGILLIVYVRQDLLPHVHDIQSSICGVGIMNRMGNKGAAAIRFKIHDTSVCFVSSHLAADSREVERRNADFNEIMRRIVFEPPLTDVQGDSMPAPLEILSHDLVFWLGDLNYRIVDMEIETVKQHIREGKLTKLIQYDQLTMERAKGLVFKNFKEAPITFAPTYKFDVGTDTYDTSEKQRCPAWTDRILHHAPGGDMKQLNYKSHPELTCSDHKPVSALFDAKISVINPTKYTKVLASVRDENVQLLNAARPVAELEPHSLVFEGVRYMVPETKTVDIINKGLVPVRWRFVPPREGMKTCCKSWLRIKPMKGSIPPGEKETITFKVLVGNLSAVHLNDQSDAIDDILVIRLEQGGMQYVDIQGSYLPTPFATPLETLVSNPCAVRAPTDVRAASVAANQERRMVPDELLRLGEYIRKNGLDTPGLLEEEGIKTEVQAIADCLATGAPFDTSFKVHSYVETLLLFLRSLPEPVIPGRFRDRALRYYAKSIPCQQLVSELPVTHYHVFNYLVQLARDMLAHAGQSAVTLDQSDTHAHTHTALVFGDVIIRTPTSTRPELASMRNKCKAGFMRHFLAETNGKQ